MPQTIPQYNETASNNFPAPPQAIIESDGISYLGEASGVPMDATPWPYYSGDPNLSPGPAWDVNASPYPDPAHADDKGAPGYYHKGTNPDIGNPSNTLLKTQSTDNTTTYDPQGMIVSVDGPRTALDTGHDTNTRNLGYTYIEYAERPFYNTLAEPAPELHGGGGLFQGDGTYSQTVYNDGGIPPVYSSPVEPPTAPAPSALDFMPQDIGYGSNF